MIDKESILQNAKFLAFPILNNATGEFRYNDSVAEAKYDWVCLPPEKMVYRGYDRNAHHFTTEYHRKFVLPTLENMLHFGYSESDFRIRENPLHKNGEVFDLSFLQPLRDKKFSVKSLQYDLEYECWFKGLRKNENTRSVTWFTEYHDLYCLPHSSSIVKNTGKTNGRSLLILGDSQLIPSISVLCYYYKEVAYIDNRDKVNILSSLNDRYDDVLIQTYIMPLGYYLDFLR